MLGVKTVPNRGQNRPPSPKSSKPCFQEAQNGRPRFELSWNAAGRRAELVHWGIFNLRLYQIGSVRIETEGAVPGNSHHLHAGALKQY